MARKNWDLEKPLQIKLDRWTDKEFRADAAEKMMSISTLGRLIFKEHYKRLKAGKQR